jgi:DNA replication protein DnaC
LIRAAERGANLGAITAALMRLLAQAAINKSTLITTNRAFGEWNEVFANAACVVSLVDRLVHNAEIVASKANPIASRKPGTAPMPGHASAAAPSHEYNT